MSDSSLSSMTQIKNLVRFYTNNLSANQLSDEILIDKINTFLLYDFPGLVQLIDLRKKLTFYTQPFVDVYESNTVNDEDALYNLQNKYMYFYPSVFIKGGPVNYSQQPDGMNLIANDTVSTETINTGDGLTQNFYGTITGICTATGQSKLIRKSIVFSSIDNINEGIIAVDTPTINPITGYYQDDGILVEPNFPTVARGTINYLTGVYDVTFNAAPAAGQAIYAQTVKCSPSLPNLVSFYDNKFILRPVPDKVYKVEIVGQLRPTELVNNNSPEIAAWFQFIAAGAAKKVFEGIGDDTGIQRMLSIMDEQRNLIMVKTIKLINNQTAQVINATTFNSKLPWS